MEIRKKAGRISPTPMGDYDNTTVYRRLDWVYYGGTSYICKKNNTLGITPSNISNWQKILESPSDTLIYFDEAETRENISSGEKLSVILGKIMKCISDIKNVAFSGSYNDLLDTPKSLKNPNSLNIKFNGTSQVTYDGSIVKEADVTPEAINAVNISTILTTKEQISANTNADNVTGALAAKEIIADINQINSNLTNLIRGATWLPRDGYDTLVEDRSIVSVYSVNPGIVPKQGLPSSGYNEYGTLITFGMSEYKNMLYIDLFGNMATYNTMDQCWHNYVYNNVKGIEGHNYKIGYDNTGAYIVIDGVKTIYLAEK